MTDKLISDLGAVGAAIADNTATEVQRNGQTTTEQALGSDWKTYIKSWIAKADVGLSNVKNVTSQLGFKDYKTGAGRYYALPGVGSGSTGALAGAGRIFWVPVIFPIDVTASALSARISAGSAGNFKMAVYAADATTGWPTGAALASGGDGSTAAGPAVVDSLFSGGSGTNMAFTAGTLYWIGANCDNTTASFTTTLLSSNPIGYLIGSTTGTNLFSASGVLGNYYTANAYASAWPTLTGLEPTANGGNQIMPILKVA